ncbi:mannan-binding lectin serine protease 1 isoform X2 [Syngnathoides biaculeatus]|uniref:mannan-binding lectin serine protease 1 isoform X2 n=1 Tax=Syngnathoides biaculeatus TaxID=300417 RepID=UPI002ADDFE9E|nr:mannan-binding lectin serine protease 1 isoform X2 [Syngnathoides biaculeatus]
MRALLACVCALLGAAEASRTAALTEPFGSFQSPDFPANYPDDTLRHWEIRVPHGFRVRLHFSHFDLEPSESCQYDYVKVEAGGGASPLGLFCGGESSDPEKTSPTRKSSQASELTTVRRTWTSALRAWMGGPPATTCATTMWAASTAPVAMVTCSTATIALAQWSAAAWCFPSARVPSAASTSRRRTPRVPSARTSSGRPRGSSCASTLTATLTWRTTRKSRARTTTSRSKRPPESLDRFAVANHPASSRRTPTPLPSCFTATTQEKTSEAVSQCSFPAPAFNGTVTPLRSAYSSGDRVRVSCWPGFALIKDGERADGDFELRCRQDGTWNAAVPVCQRVDCSGPAAAGGARVALGGHDNGTRLGPAAEASVCQERPRQLAPEHACGRPSRPLAVQVKRIVGGRGAEPGNFPWQVLLSVEDLSRVPSDHRFGSGALLSDVWILTAAHVLRSRRRDARVVPVAPEHVKVLAGAVDVRDKRASAGLAVSQVLIHPDFRPSDFDNDVALVKLTVRVELNNAIRPICLPPPPQGDGPSPPPHSLGAVAGWGVSLPDVTSDLLQFVWLPVVPQDECRASYAARAGAYNISDNMFCAGFYEGGRDTCLGDSGGAFVAQDPVSRQWTALGLVSWAGPEECGSRRVYGVYTRVNKYLKWIEQHLLLVT